MNGGFTPCPQLRSYSGRELTVFILIQAGNDDDDDGEKTINRKAKPLPSTTCLGYSGPILPPGPHRGGLDERPDG